MTRRPGRPVSDEAIFKAAGAVLIVAVLLTLALIAGMGFLAAHFLAKVW